MAMAQLDPSMSLFKYLLFVIRIFKFRDKWRASEVQSVTQKEHDKMNIDVFLIHDSLSGAIFQTNTCAKNNSSVFLFFK